MKTRSAVVVIALVCAGASGCGPGLEPPKASTGGVPTTPGISDHGGLPGAAGSAAGFAGTGAASAADASAPTGSGGAGGKSGKAGRGAAGSGGDAGIDEDAGH